MRAMVVRRYGSPEVFEWRDLPDPQPTSGEVLIRVKAVGVNFADIMQRMGLYPGTPKPPFVPGIEISGVIEKTAEPSKATQTLPLRPGDAVVAISQFQAYAEWAAVPARQVYRMPIGMPFEHGAAIPVNYLTAYHSMFTMGNLCPGDRILIHGAAGGVGSAAVQLARSRGLVIFGSAGPAKQDYLRKIGVDHPIDHERSDFVQVVRNFARSYRCLGPTGRLIAYGFSAAAGSGQKRNWLRSLSALLQTPRFHPLKLMSQNVSVIGVNIGKFQTRAHLLRSELDEIFRLYGARTIKPVISQIFPLAHAAQAHQYIHERKNIGKVILTVK